MDPSNFQHLRMHRLPELENATLVLALSGWMDGQSSADFYQSSPVHFLPRLNGEHLARLRQRFLILAVGEGRWERPSNTWRAATN